MIKASELRIGNYVFDDKGSIQTIEGISRKGSIHEEIRLLYFHGVKEPDFDRACNSIPLNEELVLKLGFIEIPDGYWTGRGDKSFRAFQLDGFNLVLNDEDNCFYTWSYCEDEWYSELDIKVESVHDLQNTHHSKYKEEIKIQL